MARLHVLHAHAAAVHGDDQHTLVLAGRLERLVRAGRGGLVDGVDEVDVRCLLQAVLHRGLSLGLVAARVLAAEDLRVALLDAVALEEAVVSQLADGDPGREVERGDLDRKSTRLNSSHLVISYAVFCLKIKSSFNEAIAKANYAKFREIRRSVYFSLLYAHEAVSATSLETILTLTVEMENSSVLDGRIV